MTKQSDTYEEVAAYLLNQCASQLGLDRVEGKQAVAGKRSGTSWVIDAKGVKSGTDGIVIVECRRYTTSKQKQEQVGALAYRIIDTGAEGGIFVSPLGLQSGAELVASAENIISIELDENSTTPEYFLKFLNQIMIGVSSVINMSDFWSLTLMRSCAECGEHFEVQDNEKSCPRCANCT